MVRHGEIRWLTFRPPDRRRPVLVLTRDAVVDMLSDISVAPITRTIREIPSQVVLDRSDGMPERCAINLDRIATVDRSRLGDLVTSLPAARLQELRDALLFAYQLDGV